jgi:hypothetical protein
MVRRLDRAKAENKECNRRKSATGAIDSENFQGLTLRTSQTSEVNLDPRITLQPEIAATPGYKSSDISVDPDVRLGLVKTVLGGRNHIEFILNRI